MSKYNLTDIFEQYRIGSGFTRDFDYEGMLKAGLETGVDTDIKLLKYMVEDYTDVNYHREASHLYKAIEALEDGQPIDEISMLFGDFHAEIRNTMETFDMGTPDTLGGFMDSYIKEDYKPSHRAYNVIDGKGNIVYKHLPRHTAIEKASEREDYGFIATDNLAEDLDLGHEDNEPGMLKAELYHIGNYAMELYKMMDDLEGMGEVDFPSWWQSKVTTAKNNISSAKHYLDFELKEPRIDAVVDVATDVVDEEVGQLGTDDDTGFKASLYTPNELDDVSVGREYASGAFEESKQPIEEAMNMNKWRRAYNGKAFAKKTVFLTDYNNNKKRYTIYFKYKETPSKDIVSLSESHYGNHEGSGMAFAMSNLQNKPVYQFTSDDKFEWDNEEEFDAWVAEGPKGLESLLSHFLGGQNVDKAIRAWFDTGVTDKSKLRIGPAEYFPDAAVNENKSSKYSTIAEKLAKDLKEGLPKGFWDKKMDAEDEVKEEQGMDPERFVGSGGDEVDQDSNINVTKDNPAQDAEIGFGLEEDYDSLVGKIKKQGKSAKAAKAIAGAVAAYKAKGGGKGPTAKQK